MVLCINPFVLEPRYLMPNRFFLPRNRGVLHFVLHFLVLINLFPYALLGLAGMPRRIQTIQMPITF